MQLIFILYTGPCQDLDGMAVGYVIENNDLTIRPYRLEDGSYTLGSLAEIEDLNSAESKDKLR